MIQINLPEVSARAGPLTSAAIDVRYQGKKEFMKDIGRTK